MVGLASLLIVLSVWASRTALIGAQDGEGGFIRGLLRDQQQLAASSMRAGAGGGGDSPLGGGGRLPNVSLPGRFSDVLRSTPEWAARVLPETLQSKYSGKVPNTKLVKLHWAIISCDRNMWGRMMTHSLLSGLFNELRPTTISIVWCKPYKKEGYPPLLHDLRHSHSVNVFFPNADLMQQTIAAAMNIKEGSMLNSTQLRKTDPTYLTALMVPLMLRRPDLPLVLSEDDAVFAPDANARLATALGQIEHLVRNDPFIIQLYEHNRRTEAAPDRPEQLGQPRDDVSATRLAHDAESTTVHHQLSWGTQGYFFSPGMTMIFLHYWLNMTLPQAEHKNYGQDYHIVFHLRQTLKCNQPGSECWYYQMNPALLQHIGTSSSLFSGKSGKALNQKWHMSRSFPVQVAMPGYENKWSWRRTARRLGL